MLNAAANSYLVEKVAVQGAGLEALVGAGLEEEGAGSEGRRLTRPCSAATAWRRGSQKGSRSLPRRSRRIAQ